MELWIYFHKKQTFYKNSNSYYENLEPYTILYMRILGKVATYT